MALKPFKLSVPPSKKPIDPLEIFNKLTLRGSIENIWEPQADALREWYKVSASSDIVVQMNTGGGKTLVGLLIAQSLVNTTKGRVLYVCPNNQLVEQTAERVKELGLGVAIRYKSTWVNREAFDSGDAFCLTNYATLFNGKSIFRNEMIDGVVFDDAHVAENTIRSQFTLKIPTTHPTFRPILQLFRRHFATSSQASRFDDIANGRKTPVLLVPGFIVWQHAAELRQTFIDNGVEGDDELLFAWEHLKEHLDRCCVLGDGGGIEITPVLTPLSESVFFGEDTKRVYLTATLPSQAAFARTFGVATPKIIQPTGKSGDAQRLFVFIEGKDDGEQRERAKELVANHKSCVISPSTATGNDWVPPATIYRTDSGQEEITRFSHSDEPEMLCLVARYDGIDLPGDACRVLILDRLPTGESRIDKFIDESIRVETIRTSHTATRVVQAIGRIFRSNTDHGVVVLVGPQLQSWIRTPRNRAYLPKLLQQQILLATELSKQVQNEETSWNDLMNGVLEGEPTWDQMYEEYIDEFDAEFVAPEGQWHIDLIVGERQAYELLWRGQCQQAANAYAGLVEKASQHDKRLAAWLRHWRGVALLCADDKNGALTDFIAAANVRSELGRPSERRDSVFKASCPDEIGEQANVLAAWYRKSRHQIPAALEQVEKELTYGPDTARAEEALRVLGTLLGLRAERPDKSTDTGPDVIWNGNNDLAAWGFELKTDKNKDGEYSKKEIGQCHDHEEWLHKSFGDSWELTVLGPMLSVSSRANPSSTLRVSEVDSFRELFDRVRAMFDAVESADKANLEETFQTWLNYHGLTWPICVESLDNRLAVDLKHV